MLRSQHAQVAQALLATRRQHCIAFLLASATALLTAVPSFHEDLWPLAWVALVPLFVALREASPKRALLLGWWAETLMYWLGFYWLIGTMVHFGISGKKGIKLQNKFPNGMPMRTSPATRLRCKLFHRSVNAVQYLDRVILID